MPNVKVAVAVDNKAKVVMKVRLPDKEPKQLGKFDTTKIVNMVQSDIKKRDFYLYDVGLTYDQFLMMIITGVSLTRWQVIRLGDIFGRDAVEKCMIWGTPL